MSEGHDSSTKFERLRQQAEALLKKGDSQAETPSDFLDVLHELKVHQAELEIQNEELKQAQQELSEARHEFENLYEFAPCGYLTLNAQGIITRANLTAVRLLQCSRQYLLHSGMSQFIEQGSEDLYHALRQEVVRTGDKQSKELPLKQKGEKPLWVRTDLEAELDTNGGVRQWRMVLLDISAQRQAEEDKEIIEEQLRQSQKMESIGTLAGGIAHEFNNILSIILGNTELASDEIPDWSPAAENLKEIRNAGLRARDVVGQILMFSRHHDTEKKPMDIGTVVQDSIKLIRSSTPQNIEIKQLIPEDLHPILGNVTQINQLLINLCSNASDTLLHSGGLIRVELMNENLDQRGALLHHPLTPGPYVRLVVADNGSGMDQKTLARIFDPYFTTKEVDKGTGIGLAVVHGIVKRHKGSITAESKPGYGTSFSIRFPACPGALEVQSEGKSELPTGTERILFIDDEPSILKLGLRRLKKLGYKVQGSTDPEEALAIFQADPQAFDLVITDMAMPKMTGEQLVHAIVPLRPDLPIILCTGYSDRISEDSAQELGLAKYLEKPLDMLSLPLSVREVLDGQ